MRCSRRFPRRFLRCLSVLICLTLGLTSLAINPLTFLDLSAAARSGQSNGKARTVKPARPEKVAPFALPNLDQIKLRPQTNAGAPPPISSSGRSKRKPLESPQKLKSVPGTTAPGPRRPQAGNRRTIDRAQNEARALHHASRRSLKPQPLLTDDQYVEHFLSLATPNYQPSELTYWRNLLRTARTQGLDALLIAAREMGRTLFESAAYAARTRTNHEYIYDLYQTYLMRDPSNPIDSGWAFWEANIPSSPIGRAVVRESFLGASSEFHDLVAALTPDGAVSGAPGSIAGALVDPFNQTGDQIQGRDCEWSLPLLSLPGRAGLDLGLRLSYSSLVWTRSGPYLYFDEDRSSISPGFRLGFATISGQYFDPEVGKKTYLLISSSGRRVELRQVDSSNIYEAADSSYLQLIDNGGTLVLRTTDGTQITYERQANGWQAPNGAAIVYDSQPSDWQAVQVKDSNGNYLSIVNDWRGIQTVVDTLGRVIYFSYDGNGNLQSITQYWNGGWHTWATFGWGANLGMDVSGFTGASVTGTYQGEQIPVLRQVGLPDGSTYKVEYTAAAQVNMIRRYTYDNVERSHTGYDYDDSSSDCPRTTQARVWADNWSAIAGLPTESVTSFGLTGDGAHEMVAPDGTTYRDYYYPSGWQKGLIMQSEVWGKSDPQNPSSPLLRQKWTTTQWTQDNEAVSYQTNPRVWQTNVYDAGGNRRCIVTAYQGPFSRPLFVAEFNPSVTAVIRRTYFEYVDDAAYTNQRLLGLMSRQTVYDAAWTPVSRISYGYDNPYLIQSQATYAVMHDDTYDQNRLTRGNVTSISRWDATDVDNSTKVLTTQMTYDAAGNLVLTADPLGHQTTMGFADAFSDNTNRNTFAYPTTISDADDYSSYMQYNYDYGSQTRVQTPQPNTTNNVAGPVQTFEYDNVLRLTRTTNLFNNAYTRYVYGPTYWQSWSSVNNLTDENYSMTLLDGLGRTVGVAHEHPGSAGNYEAQLTVYDVMGRAGKQSNPTEINGAWTPYGDDAAGWQYNVPTEYDWKGRPTKTYSMDGNYQQASYQGCGCAGGEVVTLTDERGRQQKVYADFLGRQWKSEVLDDNSNVYSSTATVYNAGDQITAVNSYKGIAAADLSCPSGTCMQSVTNYDGYGRVASRRLPQQTDSTTYEYNADDTVRTVTDPRGVVATNSFNNRHLITGIAYSATGGVPELTSVSYGYDAAGNRSTISDGTGSTTYSYDQISRMSSEIHHISGLGAYQLTYGYNFANELTSITDPSGAQVSYSYDSTGRLTGMPASGYNGVTSFLSNAQYRASGAMKHATYGNSVQVNLSYNSRLQIGQYQVSGFQSPSLNMGASMTYYDDGRTNTAFDLNNSVFDRKYEFDFVARLKEAYSGAEAHGAPPPPLNQANSPYRQSYTYDEWNNVTQRTGRIWAVQNDSEGAVYGSDNKRSSFNYDNAGNVTWADNDGGRTYDAAGRPVTFTSEQQWQVHPDWPSGHPNAPALETTDTFDGAGQVVKHINHTRHDDTTDLGGGNLVYYMSDTTTTTYYIRSTVLGGKTIAELNANGVKTKGYVYSGGGRIATQTIAGTSNSVEIEATNPVTGASIITDANGTYAIRQEPDPLGRELSVAPDLSAAVDPIASPKWNEPMPIEYSPHWTGEMESGMEQYQKFVNERTAAYIYNATKREFLNALFDLAQSGDNKFYDKMQKILTKNPNFLISINGEWTAGRDAANALAGAMANLPGDPLGISQGLAQENRGGGDDKEYKRDLTKAEWKKLEGIFEAARQALTNSECSSWISDSIRQWTANPTNDLNALISTRHFFYGGEPNTYATTYTNGGFVTSGWIGLRRSFFKQGFFGQVETILHELRHASSLGNVRHPESFHGDLSTKQFFIQGGGVVETQEEFHDGAVKNCITQLKRAMNGHR